MNGKRNLQKLAKMQCKETNTVVPQYPQDSGEETLIWRFPRPLYKMVQLGTKHQAHLPSYPKSSLGYSWCLKQCKCYINSCHSVLFREQWQGEMYVCVQNRSNFLKYLWSMVLCICGYRTHRSQRANCNIKESLIDMETREGPLYI